MILSRIDILSLIAMPSIYFLFPHRSIHLFDDQKFKKYHHSYLITRSSPAPAARGRPPPRAPAGGGGKLSAHGRDIELWVDDVAECDRYAGDSEVESVVCGGWGGG